MGVVTPARRRRLNLPVIAKLRRLNLPLVGLFAACAATLGVLTSRIRDWVVMTDELQYAKLATHIGETLSPLPTLRGAHFSAYAQLYPALLAPFYGTMSAPGAFHAAHLVNALLFASAVVPAYLLARAAGLSSRWSLVCAALAVVLPWNVQAAFVMTEAAAYPVFLWASLAILRAVTTPSARRDALALLAVALAVLVRTQFASLAVVLVVTVLLYRRQGHRVLWIACAAAVVVVAVRGSRVLGSYSVTAKGFPFPWRTFEQAGAHLDLVGVGVALLPLLIGGAWIVDNVRRRVPFALYALVAIVVLTLETSSYDVRFGGGLTGIRGRYLFYVAPLLVIATARSLAERRVHRGALAGVTAFFAVTVLAHDFPRIRGLYVDAPVAVLNDVIQDSGGKWFVALAAVVLALVLVRVPQRALAICVVSAVAAGCLGTSAVAWTRLLQAHSPSGRLVAAKPAAVLDWVDSIVPSRTHAAIVPYAANPSWGPNALLWWDVEFWNRTVDRAYIVGATWDYAPFPHTQLRPDPATGVIPGTADAPPYVVVAQADARLGFAGFRVAMNYGLDILQVERPYRAVWRSRGLDPDGWTRPGRRAWIHVYSGGGAAVTLQRADGTTMRRCGSGDIRLPNRATGSVPAVPLGPLVTVMRTVGVRVTSVALGQAC